VAPSHKAHTFTSLFTLNTKRDATAELQQRDMGDEGALDSHEQVCVAVCCRVLQCVAVCCRVLQCIAACSSVLQHVAVCCSVLYFVAENCRMLLCVAAA